MNKHSFYSVIILLVSSLLLFGCGGNSSSGIASGKATMTIKWPSRTRLIPIASNSIRLDVTVNGLSVTSQIIARPVSDTTSTITVNNLPAGNLIFTASAFPSTDGTGVAQAKASIPVQIVSGGITPFSITMNSTIARLEVSPNPVSVVQGQTVDVTVTARNAAGDAVLISGSSLTINSNNTGIASVFSGRVTTKLTGLQLGSTTLFVSESESSTTINVPVNVAKGTVPSYSSKSIINGTGNQVYAKGLNDNGDVLAMLLIPTLNVHFAPYLYSAGVTKKLANGTSPNDTDSIPYFIRNDGVIVGTSYTYYGTAVEWASGTSPAGRLAVVGSINSNSEARSMNAAGTIVGISNGYPAIWTPFSLSTVPPIPGGQAFGTAFSINDAGTIVGSMKDGSGNVRAFVSDGTTTTALPDMGHGSVAKWINTTGDIVGSINILPSGSSSTFQHAALWHNGVLTDLGTLPGDSTSEAVCINSSGLIVGTSGSGGFLIKGGVMYPLTALGSGHGPITTGVAINNSGQILGNETITYTNPILLTPN